MKWPVLPPGHCTKHKTDVTTQPSNGVRIDKLSSAARPILRQKQHMAKAGEPGPGQPAPHQAPSSHTRVPNEMCRAWGFGPHVSSPGCRRKLRPEGQRAASGHSEGLSPAGVGTDGGKAGSQPSSPLRALTGTPPLLASLFIPDNTPAIGYVCRASIMLRSNSRPMRTFYSRHFPEEEAGERG